MGEIYRRSFIRTNRVFMRSIGRPFANVKMIDERRSRAIRASGRFGAVLPRLCLSRTATIFYS